MIFMGNGRILTGHPLHQGIISSDPKGFWKSPLTKGQFHYSDHIANFLKFLGSFGFGKIEQTPTGGAAFRAKASP
ncbi:MAG: hypothetical protein KKD99_09530, partial [Proteobacteria bacterium]|nr:hypothetical protein [Pseudomonadota bacterium]